MRENPDSGDSRQPLKGTPFAQHARSALPPNPYWGTERLPKDPLRKPPALAEESFKFCVEFNWVTDI